MAEGEIRYKGDDVLRLGGRRLAALRGTEIGLVLQDPFTMLNPLRKCGRHIDELLVDERGKRLSRSRRREEVARRLEEVRISDASVGEQFPFQLSGGMRQRVAIASALARDPELLIADEPSTALDVTTQAEILSLLATLQAERGMALVLITHDLRIAFSACDRVYVLYAGSLVEVGPADALEREPLHPYTLGLLLSEPPPDRRVAVLQGIDGSVPSPDEVADRCPFQPRCRWAAPACVVGPTPLRALPGGRASACVRIEEIRDEMTEVRERLTETEPPAPAVVSSPLLKVDELTKVFVTRSRRVVAVDGASLQIGENESVGLVGESGSGKTTIARCVVGLETPDSGSIELAGIDATTYAALSASSRRTLRSSVQIVFQDPYSSLNPTRTIGSTLSEAITAHNPRSRQTATEVRALLVRVGLPESYARRKPVALSGGERQRVAIARALAVRPRLLVCDEPVSALDVSVQAQILNLLRTLREESGMSYLFVSHDLAVIRQIVDRAYVLLHGRIVEAGPVEGLFESPQHEYTKRLLASVPGRDDEAA